MKFTIVSAILLAAGVTAAPATPVTPVCKGYVDNFDKLPTSVLSLLTPVGTVNGTNYKGFNTVVPFGIKPKSGLKVAAAALQNSVLSFGKLSLNPFGTLIAASNSFDLKGFNFGCTLNIDNTFLSIPEGCNITVTGFDVNNKQIPPVVFNFFPRLYQQQPMAYASLPATFSKLKNVTIGVAVGSTGLVPLESVLQIDDVSHCNY